MIIVNADDWGRGKSETDAALSCYRKGRVTSASAMVFMEDSHRAAEMAMAEQGLDVGLHLNLSQPFTGSVRNGLLSGYHERVARFLTFSKYSLLLYNPFLRKQFDYVCKAQIDEFIRLYGRPPSHIDGHLHLHLCTNVLVDNIIPHGERVRRNFSFQQGEKGPLNRGYRSLVDLWLSKRYRLTDFFFALSQNLHSGRLIRVVELARAREVELMAHPAKAEEYACLMSHGFFEMLRGLQNGAPDPGDV